MIAGADGELEAQKAGASASADAAQQDYSQHGFHAQVGNQC